MSDHNERACTQCGSLLHHEADCPEISVCLNKTLPENNPASDTTREAAERIRERYTVNLIALHGTGTLIPPITDEVVTIIDDSTTALRSELSELTEQLDLIFDGRRINGQSHAEALRALIADNWKLRREVEENTQQVASSKQAAERWNVALLLAQEQVTELTRERDALFTKWQTAENSLVAALARAEAGEKLAPIAKAYLNAVLLFGVAKAEYACDDSEWNKEALNRAILRQSEAEEALRAAIDAATGETK